MIKRCFKCGSEKPLSEFYKHTQMADGYLGKCKKCTKTDTTSHRHENIDKYREHDKERSKLPHRKSLAKQLHIDYKNNYPERKKANDAVSNAVRCGKIKKLPCIICGDEKSVAHHHDYSQPLAVNWLCQVHHKAAHAVSILDLQEDDLNLAKIKPDSNSEKEKKKRIKGQVEAIRKMK